MKCRHCHTDLKLPFIDLGTAPPSNAYIDEEDLRAPEKYFPLRVMICTECWLVQTEDFTKATELFSSNYAYFSSFSTEWLNHAEKFVACMIERFDMNSLSHVVEVAANDGYLLQYFKGHGVPCLGIEPTAGTAASARTKGIIIVEDFFSESLAKKLAKQGKQADLIVANNVLAHVPDINDFVSGFSCLLKRQGVAIFEFPHLMRLVSGKQFDTIYHEHFSYLSLTAISTVFESNGLSIFDVEELPTHGGSLRVFAQCPDSGNFPLTENVKNILDLEAEAGMKTREYYKGFQEQANCIKDDFISFLINAKHTGKRVIAYGAAAKGNTLINYAGIRPDLLPFVIDRNPAKQGKYLPGSRIPIVDESCLIAEKPDFVVILPWNLRNEVMTQLAYIRQWNGKFVAAVPSLMII